MTAMSAYAPTRRNSFLIRHPDAIQRRSSRLKRRRSASVALVLLLIRFWDSPAIQRVWRLLRLHNVLNHDTTRRLMESEWSQSLVRRGLDIRSVLSRGILAILERLQHYARQLGYPQSEIDNVEVGVPRGVNGHDAVDALNGMTNGTSRESLSKKDGTEDKLASVRENRQIIHSILMYWFGQYSPDNSQKKLWMVASSSTVQRRRVDAEIVQKFERVILSLSDKGGVMMKDWCTDTDLYGYEGKVAAIVALDQFTRHVRRHYESLSKVQCPIPAQKDLDALAYSIAQSFTTAHEKEISCGMVPLPMYVFALMPYRHASSLSSVRHVQQCIEDCAAMEEQMDGMIRRFRKATNRRMAVLQDEARRTGKSEKEGDSEGEVSGESTADHTNYSVEDESKDRVYADQDILETFPFDADMASAKDHPVHRTIRSFLAHRGIHPTRKSKGEVSTASHPVIVSLSGGVDSMVIAAVLSHLSNACDYDLHIVAIHIDYANRPESGAEADYVKKFCQRLGVVYKCRVVDEVTRGITNRDDYERIAREARYGTYRLTVQECKEQMTDSSLDVGVMLGHHRGDLRENVLSNAHKGCGPLDLSGMTSVSQNDGVVIYRPLLPLEKKDIYDYAHKFGVPYFKDTTPHWSTRGKLRNKLLPLLEEIYGEGSMDNLSTLATESDEARELLQESLFGPFLNQVQHKPMGITFDTAPWFSQGLFFWKFVLREALHGAGLGMFSDKSVNSFLGRIQEQKVKSGWLQCRRDYAVYLQENGKVFVFYPDSFPFRKADQYPCQGQVAPFGKENALRVGPWLVTSELVSASPAMSEADVEALLEKKAISSMDQFMNGCIRYYIKAPLSRIAESGTGELPRPLVASPGFNRETRPRAWKKSDMKIQSTLPLLGNDEKAVEALADAKTYGSEWVLVKVTLTRDGADAGAGDEEAEVSFASPNEAMVTADSEDKQNTSFTSEVSDHDKAIEFCNDLN